jgi:hypothetical protein
MTPTTKRTNQRFLVPLALAALASTGCGSGQNWRFAIKSQNDKAVIDMDRVTLIFEDVAVVLPEGQTEGGASGSLTVAGSGTSTVTVTAFGKSFTNSYSNGVNTMTFEEHTLKLIDAGTTLQIGTQEFDLTGEKKTLVIRKDGGAEVQETN